jgi:DNA-directed RNA polymerase subunit M/transcription elongation factor TFIIS
MRKLPKLFASLADDNDGDEDEGALTLSRKKTLAEYVKKYVARSQSNTLKLNTPSNTKTLKQTQQREKELQVQQFLVKQALVKMTTFAKIHGEVELVNVCSHSDTMDLDFSFPGSMVIARTNSNLSHLRGRNFQSKSGFNCPKCKSSNTNYLGQTTKGRSADEPSKVFVMCECGYRFQP